MLEPWGEKRDPSPNRGPWIIAGAVLVAAVLIVGVVWFLNDRNQDQDRADRCAEIAFNPEHALEANELGCYED